MSVLRDRFGPPRSPRLRVRARCRRAGEQGASLAEYVILASLIAAVAAAGITAFGQAVLRLYQTVPAGL